MYLGLGKSIIQFVVPPPGHGPLDILSDRPVGYFSNQVGTRLCGGNNLPSLIEMG